VTNFRFTAPKAASYRVSAAAYMNAVTAAQDCEMHIYKNGSAYLSNFATIPATYMNHKITADVDCAVGDYIEIFITSGGDTSYNVVNDAHTYLTISEVAAGVA
jgi:hypothetical protein